MVSARPWLGRLWLGAIFCFNLQLRWAGPSSVSAFHAHLTRPWHFKRGQLRIRARKRAKDASATTSRSRQVLSVSSTLSSLAATSPTNGEELETNDKNSNEDPPQQPIHHHRHAGEHDAMVRMTPPLLETNSSLASERFVASVKAAMEHKQQQQSTANNNNKTKQQLDQKTKRPTVWNQLGPLTKMTRPQNFPGIFLFHLIGIYIALESVDRMDMFVGLLLGQPSMWLVLSSVVLVSCTSMVVNDYYDAKLGRDTSPDRPLVRGDLSFQLVRRYLSYLYAVALVCAAVLPGAPARLAVILSLMLTYWYTNHLKPLTWVKNAVCAFLIAFAPVASGSAALHLVSKSRSGLHHFIRMGPIWRVVAMLFFGVLGREMTMDCNDVENDRAVGVQTIPVVHGPVYTTRVALLCAGISSALALAGPLRDIGRVPRALWGRRLVLAGSASVIQMIGAFRVWQTEGRDRDIVDRTVNAGAMFILLFLASYL